MSHSSKLALVAAALLAAPLASVGAQETADMYNPSRFTVEGYLSQMYINSDANEDDNVGGVGARVMFGRADASQALSTIFNRARVGAFFTYNAEQGDAEVRSFHYGAQADFPLFAAPRRVGIVLDPFVSLGAGIFHLSTPSGVQGARLTSDDFAFTPAVGTLIPITGEIKFRGDIRDAIVFGEGDTSNNFVLEGGISIGF